MTSLKSKIIRNFLAVILACILVFSIAISYLLSIYTKNFLDTTEDVKPDQVKKQLEVLLTINDPYNLKERLDSYSKALNVDIEILDKENREILNFKGRNEDDKKDFLKIILKSLDKSIF